MFLPLDRVEVVKLCYQYALQNSHHLAHSLLQLPLGWTCLGAWFCRTTCHRGMGGTGALGQVRSSQDWVGTRVRYAQPVFCLLPLPTLPCCGHVTCVRWPAVGPWARLGRASPLWAEEERIGSCDCPWNAAHRRFGQLVVGGFSLMGLVWF